MARIAGCGALSDWKARIAEMVVYSITLALKYVMNFAVSGSARDVLVGHVI